MSARTARSAAAASISSAAATASSASSVAASSTSRDMRTTFSASSLAASSMSSAANSVSTTSSAAASSIGERRGDDIGGLCDGGLLDELGLDERLGDLHGGGQLDLLGRLDGVLGFHLDAQLVAHDGEGVGRDHRLHERPAAGIHDRVAEARRPVVLDDEDRRGAAGGDRVGELLHPVHREAGVALGDGECAELRALDHALGATRVEPDQPAGDRAETHPLVLGQVGQVHRVLDAAVPVLLDEDDVDEADHAALPRPAQLGHDPAGRLELVEPDHEHLDRAGHVLVCHVCSPSTSSLGPASVASPDGDSRRSLRLGWRARPATLPRSRQP